MMTAAFVHFDTAIGRCAIVWGAAGIVGAQLPEAREAQMRARIQRRFPQAHEAAPPPSIQSAINEIVALTQGEPRDLSAIVLNMDGVPSFDRTVYELARTIRCGDTLTYGEIAARLRRPDAARAVGQALGRNPFPIIVPCHRVMAAGGGAGGFSANGGVATKLRLLNIEGAMLHRTPTLFEGDPAFGLAVKAARSGR